MSKRPEIRHFAIIILQFMHLSSQFRTAGRSPCSILSLSRRIEVFSAQLPEKVR